jgi:aminoglycoside/choline kinase family phosphotransferase
MTDPEKDILSFYREFSGKPAELMEPLTPAGSPRKYYRIRSGNETMVATHNPDQSEIQSFIYLAEKLSMAGIAVPKVYAVREDRNIYLQEDIGDISLFSLIEQNDFKFSDELLAFFRRALKDLLVMQIEVHQGIDYSRCYPVAVFDTSAILFDLHYFKQFFLGPHSNNPDDKGLEEDFRSFASFLSQAGAGFFMFRDFQSRNIFIREGRLHYIDFQGGRRGALQYDPAALLNQTRIMMPESIRERLLKDYLSDLEGVSPELAEDFLTYYPGFCLLRLLQNLGTYGFRGIQEGKSLFIRSIAPAMKQLEEIIQNTLPLHDYSVLRKSLENLLKEYSEQHQIDPS